MPGLGRVWERGGLGDPVRWSGVGGGLEGLDGFGLGGLGEGLGGSIFGMNAIGAKTASDLFGDQVSVATKS